MFCVQEWEIFNSDVSLCYSRNMIYTYPVEKRLLEILRESVGVTKPKFSAEMGFSRRKQTFRVDRKENCNKIVILVFLVLIVF